MQDEFTQEQFAQIMELSEKLEDLVEGKDFFICAHALSVVIARGSRSALAKHRQEFTKEDFLRLFLHKSDYWWDFYDYMDEVKEGEKQ